MTQRILITGGTGFIGRALCHELLQAGHELTVLSRHPAAVAKKIGPGVTAWSSLEAWQPPIHFDAVINLAGAPIVGAPWTASRKQVLRASRIELTERLVAAIARAERPPEVLISGSAIGFYGDRGDEELDESSPGGSGFAHQLCADWEQAALAAELAGVRVCLVRTGLVVGRNGGFLKGQAIPFRIGLGVRLGAGRQWMPWIHLADEVGIIRFLLETPQARGIFNATAPHPVTHAVFTQAMATQLHSLAVLPIPEGWLRRGAGEMAELLLGSQRVLPRRVVEAGYRFRYESLDEALTEALADSRFIFIRPGKGE